MIVMTKKRRRKRFKLKLAKRRRIEEFWGYML
jgi:hypothetical protein